MRQQSQYLLGTAKLRGRWPSTKERVNGEGSQGASALQVHCLVRRRQGSLLSEDKRYNAFRSGSVSRIVWVSLKKHALLDANAYPGTHADKQCHGHR
jgi:hypothetical protein